MVLANWRELGYDGFVIRAWLGFCREQGAHAAVENLGILRLTIALRVGIISCTSFQEVLTLGSGGSMVQFFRNIWTDERGQDIAEYAVMLAVILVLVIGTVRLIGTNANNVFSSVASSIPQ
jgi:Flp pilus assembly pilin Flp